MGGGGHPDFFVKFDFEKAVDQKTRARDRTFEGVPDSECPRDSHAHTWSVCNIQTIAFVQNNGTQ